MKIFRIILKIILIGFLVFISMPFVMWQYQKWNERDNVKKSTHSILETSSCSELVYEEVYIAETMTLLISLKKCDKIDNIETVRKKAKDLSEDLILMIDDEEFDQIEFSFIGIHDEILEKIKLNPKVDLFR